MTLVRDYWHDGFGRALVEGRSFFVMIGKIGIGWLYHPGPNKSSFRIFRVVP